MSLGFLLGPSLQTLAASPVLICRQAHRQIQQQRTPPTSMPYSLQALDQIQKEMAGNRPLPAIIRGSKKNPEIEMALVALIQNMPSSVLDLFLAKTGFEISDGKFVLKKEMKVTDREWLRQFQLQITEQATNLRQEKLKNNSAEGSNAPVSSAVSIQAKIIRPVEYTEHLDSFLTHIMDHIWKEDDRDWTYNAKFVMKFRELMFSQDAALYFLTTLKTALDPKHARIFLMEGDNTPEGVAQAYNLITKNRNAVAAADVTAALARFPQRAHEFHQYVRASIQQARAQRDIDDEKAIIKLMAQSGPKIQNVKSSSLKELLESLDPETSAFVSKNLSELIRTVDSSFQQDQKISEALRSKRPHLKLLEMAYSFKQYEELSQKEIQTAVDAALDEVTKPRLAAVHSQNEVDLSDEGSSHQGPTNLKTVSQQGSAQAEVPPHQNNSLVRMQKVQRELLDVPFLLSFHNQKEFFEVFKPGSVGFDRLESSSEDLKQKLSRVLGYFVENRSQDVLEGDGHFGRAHRRLFSVRWGAYRLLVTAKKSEDNAKQLVILCVYNKNDAKNSHKEEHFYQMAEKRLADGGY